MANESDHERQWITGDPIRYAPLEGLDKDLEEGNFPQQYQVAVLDYHLPILNGLEVARRLKQWQPDCRIIMISSELPSFSDQKGQEAVVDRFLAKPFSKDSILEVIARLCPIPTQ